MDPIRGPVRRRPALRRRFWVEAVLAALFAVMLAATLVSKEWIEELTGLEPDGGNGSLEWAIVAGLGIACIVAFGLARHDWRVAGRAMAAPAA